MEVRFTSSARDQLFSVVVTLRDEDRSCAASFLERLTDTLAQLGDDPGVAAELSLQRPPGHAGDAFRFLYRVRDETVWVLAVWPEDRRGAPPPGNGS